MARKTRAKPAAFSGARPTVWDVAERAGVSHTSVFLALRNSPRITPDRAAAIRAIADELGYRPRTAAQMLRSSRTGWIGLILQGADPAVVAESGFSSPLLLHFLAETQRRARRQMVEFFWQDARAGFVPPGMLGGGMVDAVLVGGFIDARLRDWLERQTSHPWVSIGEPGPYSVQEDAGRGVTEAVAELVALGHRRLAINVGPLQYATHALKERAFRAAIAAHGIAGSVQSFPEADALATSRAEAEWARALLGRRDRPTAMLCHGQSARTVMHVAATLGLSVPGDLSVIAFLSAVDALRALPAPTTVEADDAAVAATAIDLLEALLRGDEVAQGIRWIPPVLRRRETTGPPAVR